MTRNGRAAKALNMAIKILIKLDDRYFVGMPISGSYYETCRKRVDFLIAASKALSGSYLKYIFTPIYNWLKNKKLYRK